MKKTTLIYDGDCSFCKYWVERWKETTEDKIEYRPFQQSVSEFEKFTEEECKQAVQLITSDGDKYSAAEAVFRALAVGGNTKWKWIYKNIPLANYVFEFAYRIIANNRPFFFKLTKMFFNENN